MNNRNFSNLLNHRGFTLVEMAIVLIIIGIILGAVLKGGDLIQGAKIKSLKAESDSLYSAYYTYYDKFNRIPGDDGPTATLTARLPAALWGGATGGNGNGVINAGAEQAAATGALDHLRRAALIPGAPGTATAFVSNSFPGVTMNFSNRTLVNWGQAYNTIDLLNVPGSVAQDFDRKFDDGVANSGEIQNITGAAYGAVPVTISTRIK